MHIHLNKCHATDVFLHLICFVLFASIFLTSIQYLGNKCHNAIRIIHLPFNNAFNVLLLLLFFLLLLRFLFFFLCVYIYISIILFDEKNKIWFLLNYEEKKNHGGLWPFKKRINSNMSTEILANFKSIFQSIIVYNYNNSHIARSHT